jgi:hypothetical protein
MTCSYWAFLRSRLFVSTTPLTLSIVQLSRPDEISRDRSLEAEWSSSSVSGRGRELQRGRPYLSMNSGPTPKAAHMLSIVNDRYDSSSWA